MHTRVAGFGVQVPFGDIPSDVHTAVIFPVGTNPVSHLKSISAPPSVLGTATKEPFSGATGIPQLTEGNEMSILIWETRMLGLCSGEVRNGTEDAYTSPHSSPHNNPTGSIHHWS